MFSTTTLKRAKIRDARPCEGEVRAYSNSRHSGCVPLAAEGLLERLRLQGASYQRPSAALVRRYSMEDEVRELLGEELKDAYSAEKQALRCMQKALRTRD